MAQLIRIALIIAVNLLIYVLAEEELYSDEFDNLDPETVLNNANLRQQYIECFMKTGPCTTPQMKFFTGIFPEVLQTNCKKCTKKQKELFARGIEWLMKQDPKTWQLLVEKVIEMMRKKAAQATKTDG